MSLIHTQNVLKITTSRRQATETFLGDSKRTLLKSAYNKKGTYTDNGRIKSLIFI